jgi:hypothetical protein
MRLFVNVLVCVHVFLCASIEGVSYRCMYGRTDVGNKHAYLMRWRLGPLEPIPKREATALYDPKDTQDSKDAKDGKAVVRIKPVSVA